MADDFNSLIRQPWIGVRFLLKIQGIGDVFLDGPTPVRQTGAVWADIASGAHNFTYREHMLDVSAGGLQDIGQQITRSQGHTSPGQMSITLMDDRTGYLRELFAKDSNDTSAAVLAANLAHDTSGAGSVITVEGTISGWESTGFAYLGRETIYYPVINVGDFGTAGSKCTRDVFSIGDCDTSYTINANSNQSPRVITSKPTVWHGRYVQLYCFLVDREGRTMATNLDSMSREIFRGVIQGPPVPDQSYSRYKINCRSIDSVLHTSVGLEPVEAELVRVVGTKAENSAGNSYEFDGAKDWVQWFYISEATRYLHITLATTDDGATTYKIDLLGGLSVPHVLSAGAMIQAINVTANDAIQNGGDFDDVSINLKIHSGQNLKNKWWLSIESVLAKHHDWFDPDGQLHYIVWWDEPGSVGPLLGMTGTKQGVLFHISGDMIDYQQGDSYLAGIVGVKDTDIPFFYKGDFGLVGKTAPSSGFIRLGEEIIKYAAIETSGDSFIEGMNVLTGCTRGYAQTKIEEHRIEYGADGLTLSDRKDIKFLTYFASDDDNDDKGVSVFDIILQLAISTGSEHHGDYDTLDQYVGPAIAPGHFDLGSFEHVKASMLDHEHKVRWWFDKPVKLMELISKWLTPMGLFLTARVNDSGDYKIAVVEILPPLQAEALQHLAQVNIDATDPASWSTQDQVINEVVCRYIWDTAKGSNTEDYVCIRDTDSISDYGTKGRLEWELLGYQWDYQTAIDQVHAWAARTFARFGRPFDLLQISTDRTGWLCRPGDLILISMAGPPNTDDGSREYNGRAARVLAANYRYHSPEGQPGAQLTVIIENVQRWASYVPSGTVASVSTVTLTLNANYFTDAEIGDTDASHFEMSDYVTIFNKGDMDPGNVDLRSVISVTGNNIVINSALSNVTFDAARTIITGQVWDQPNLADSQRDHAYIATLAVIGGYDNITPFKYA